MEKASAAWAPYPLAGAPAGAPLRPAGEAPRLPAPGAQLLPATAIAERSLIPTFSEPGTSPQPLELVLQNPSDPAAITIVVQALMQHQTEMAERRREVAALQRTVAAGVQAVQQLQGQVAHLEKDKKKQAYILSADRMLRDCESYSKIAHASEVLTSFSSLVAWFAAVSGIGLMPVLIFNGGVGLAGLKLQNVKMEYRKMVWIVRTFPEAVKHAEIWKQAHGIFEDYQKLFIGFRPFKGNSQQQILKVSELFEQISKRLNIDEPTSLVDAPESPIVDLLQFSIRSIMGPTLELAAIEKGLVDLQGRIEQLERDIEKIYEVPVYSTPEVFQEQLSPPSEFNRGWMELSQGNVHEASNLFEGVLKKSSRWASHGQVGIIYCRIMAGRLIEAKKLIDDFNKDFPSSDESVNLEILALNGTIFLFQRNYGAADQCFQETRSKCREGAHLITIAGRLLGLNASHPFSLEVLYRNSPRPIEQDLLRELVRNFTVSIEHFPGCTTLLRNQICLHLELLRFEATTSLKKERLKVIGQLIEQASRAANAALNLSELYLLLSEAWLRVIVDCSVEVNALEEFLTQAEQHNVKLFRDPSVQEPHKSYAIGQRMFISLLRAMTFQGQANKRSALSDCLVGIAGDMRRFDLNSESLYSPMIEDSEVRWVPRKVSQELLSRVAHLHATLTLADEELYSYLRFIDRIRLVDAKIFAQLAELSYRLGKREESRLFCQRALDLDPANQNISRLLARLESEAAPVARTALTAPQIMPSSVVHVEAPISSKEHAEIEMFVTNLSILMQNSLQKDRNLYAGALARRRDNGDRVLELAAAAADAQGSVFTSLAANGLRVGIGGGRDRFEDLVASTTTEFGRVDIGQVCRQAAEMVAKRYRSQLIDLDFRGVEAFATYCHGNAFDKLHSLIEEPVKKFFQGLIGRADTRTYSPEEKLFFALISPRDDGTFLSTKQKRPIGEGWRADELMNLSGREYQGSRYIVAKDSKHVKYGYCHCEDQREIENLIPAPESQNI